MWFSTHLYGCSGSNVDNPPNSPGDPTRCCRGVGSIIESCYYFNLQLLHIVSRATAIRQEKLVSSLLNLITCMKSNFLWMLDKKQLHNFGYSNTLKNDNRNWRFRCVVFGVFRVEFNFGLKFLIQEFWSLICLS